MKYTRLIVALIVPQLAGVLGTLFTASSITTWYATLTKPSFNPPGWLFGPAWTLLYLLMGVSVFLIWQNPSSRARNKALRLFWIQIAFNAIWSPLFFGLKSPLLGLIDIVILLALLFYTTTLFYKIKKIAAYLLFPYIAWVAFATILNLSILLLN